MTNTRLATTANSPSQDITTRQGRPAMEAWTEYQQTIVTGIIAERYAEAAEQRLAAAVRSAGSPSGFRRGIGHFLIEAGRRMAGEPATAAPSAARSRRVVAV